MALGANTIFDVRSGGSDTANGGAFDPGQTAGMLTDGAASSGTGNSPVFSSASYNFVAGDVGAWIYVSSGTHWQAGWYQIASVASNNATLSAAVGQAYLAVNKNPNGLNTTAGCSSDGTASLTAATWAIDYSQQNAAQISYSDLNTSGAGLTVTSAAHPFGKQQVGNALTIASGTNFTAGTYVIASLSGTTATLVGAANSSTGAGSSDGVAGLGGAFATPGKAASKKVAGNDVFWQANGTTPYNLSGNTVNTAGCQVSDTTGGVDQTNVTWWVGWNTNRHINCPDTTWPILNANAQTSLTLLSFGANYTRARNLIADGNSKATLTGISQNANYSKVDHLKAQNCTVIGLDIQGGNGVTATSCSATTCSGTAGIRLSNSNVVIAFACEAYANTTVGISLSVNAVTICCISSGNTGAGFSTSSVSGNCYSCIAYGNTADGFDMSGSVGNCMFVNCLAEANGASGWKTGAVRGLIQLLNCGGYNNTSGNYTSTNLVDVQNFVANTTGSFFTNPGSGDFSLNSTANQGALARAAGFPGLMPRGTTTAYTDIGLQHQDSGGGATFIAPGPFVFGRGSPY